MRKLYLILCLTFTGASLYAQPAALPGGNTSWAISAGGSATGTANTVGASAIAIVLQASGQDATTCTVSSSPATTWEHVNNYDTGGLNAQTTLWYTWNSSGSALATSSTQTFTVGCSTSVGVNHAILMAFTGTPFEEILDQQAGAHGASSGSIIPNINPSSPYSLVITGVAADFPSGPCTLAGGFSAPTCASSGTGPVTEAGMAFQVLSAPVNINAKWHVLDGFGFGDAAALIVSFDPGKVVALRDNPTFAHIVSPGCTNATPMVCTLDTITGFAVGQTLTVNGVCSNNSGANYISPATGLRKISAISGSTISLTDTSGANIAGNGTWCDGSTSYNSGTGPQWVGVVNPYTLVQGVKEEFDGDSGPIMRQWAMGTNPGDITRFTCYVSGPSRCTVTTSYPHGIQKFDHVSVWGSGNSFLDTDGVSGDYPIYDVTTYTFSFVRPNTVSPGNYLNFHCGPGGSPNGTIAGTDSCLRISQRAVTTNYYWPAVKSNTDAYASGNAYKFIPDGGTWQHTDPAYQVWEGAAIIFLLDQSNQTYLNILDYAIQNVQKMGGVTFSVSEDFTHNDGGNYNLYGDNNPAGALGLVFKVGAPYQTATQKQDFIDKMVNDVADPTPCVRTLNQAYAIGSGTSQAGTSTTITMGSADSYVYLPGQIIQVILPGPGGSFNFYATIASYNSGTKVASLVTNGTTTLTAAIDAVQTTIAVASGAGTINGQDVAIGGEAMGLVSGAGTTTWVVTRGKYASSGYPATTHGNGDTVLLAPVWVDQYAHAGIFPPAGTAYTGSPSVSVSGGTATGIGTTFLSMAHVNDMLDAGIGANGQSGCWITAVNSDTSLTVVCSGAGTDCTHGICATSQFMVYYPKWTNGTSGTPRACGYKDGQAHFRSWGGSQHIQYPTSGGDLGYSVFGTNLETSIEATWLGLLFDVADEDTVAGRGITNLAARQSSITDNLTIWNWNAVTGASSDGNWYGFNKTLPFFGLIDWYLTHDITSYPSVGMDTSFEPVSVMKMYEQLPDQPWNGSENKQYVHTFGQYGVPCILPSGGCSITPSRMVQDWGQAAYPTAPTSQYLQGWLKNKMLYQSTNALANPNAVNWVATMQDPRIVAADYTLQPPQYILNTSARSVCQGLSGGWTWGCPANQINGMAYSRTGWSSNTDTSFLLEMRVGQGHDGPSMGAMQLYRTGYLLAADTIPMGITGTPDVLGFGAAFGNSTPSHVSPGGTAVLIPRWASGNHGAWPTAYGDQSGNYAYVMADYKSMYRLSNSDTETPNAAQKSIADMKKAGTEHVFVQYDFYDVAAPDATSIAVHTHYPQNGETISVDQSIGYDEGSTTCPGSGGCGSLNTNRSILEQETGATALPGAPSPNANLISKFMVPSGAPNVFIAWDGSTYSGAGGHTDRVSFCADASSTGACGATGQTRLELIQVHKVATQPDTSLTVTALNPDSNWTGVQTTDKVVLFARGGTTQSALTGFTTTHAGTAQYLIGGLTAGPYTVTVGGSVKWTGTVVSGDGSIEFDSAAGAVSLTAGTLNTNGTTVVGGGKFGGGVPVIH